MNITFKVAALSALVLGNSVAVATPDMSQMVANVYFRGASLVNDVAHSRAAELLSGALQSLKSGRESLRTYAFLNPKKAQIAGLVLIGAGCAMALGVATYLDNKYCLPARKAKWEELWRQYDLEVAESKRKKEEALKRVIKDAVKEALSETITEITVS